MRRLAKVSDTLHVENGACSCTVHHQVVSPPVVLQSDEEFRELTTIG
jgi:hypothetical protein